MRKLQNRNMNNDIDNYNIKERILWVDTAKALSIILIVLCHTLRYGTIDVVVSSFIVQCFFILTGITFKQEDIKKAIIKKAKKLLIPYYVFGLISVIIYYVIGKNVAVSLNFESTNTSLLSNIYGLVYCNCKTGLMQWNTPLYYLPTYFISTLVVNIFETKTKNIKNKKISRFLFVVFGFAVSYLITTHNEICLPYFSEASLLFASYIEIGIILKPLLLKNIRKKQMIAMSLLLIAVGSVIAINNLPYGTYVFVLGKNYPLCYINAIFLSIGLILIAKIINNNKVLSVVGNNTIGILCMHKFPVLFLVTLIPQINEIMSSNNDTILMNIIGIIIASMSIALCVLVIYVIMLVCPFVFGEKNKKNILTSCRKQ